MYILLSRQEVQNLGCYKTPTHTNRNYTKYNNIRGDINTLRSLTIDTITHRDWKLVILTRGNRLVHAHIRDVTTLY